jgi:hypothetical protein
MRKLIIQHRNVLMDSCLNGTKFEYVTDSGLYVLVPLCSVNAYWEGKHKYPYCVSPTRRFAFLRYWPLVVTIINTGLREHIHIIRQKSASLTRESGTWHHETK